MAVTQYIGSRYVPLFADPIEWSSANTYEPLTIVLHEGNSYTSKQAVPKGIDIANESFWAETGNYNAQIEAYRRETARAQETADEAENAAQSAQSDIDTLLPKSAFSENLTVKKYIDDSINEAKRPRLLAHRGLSTISSWIYSLDNSMWSFMGAFADGFEGFECDVRKDVNGVLVMIHDADVSSVSNSSGDIATLDYTTVKYATKRTKEDTASSLTTLDEMADLVHAFNGFCFVESKVSDVTANEIVTKLLSHGLNYNNFAVFKVDDPNWFGAALDVQSAKIGYSTVDYTATDAEMRELKELCDAHGKPYDEVIVRTTNPQHLRNIKRYGFLSCLEGKLHANMDIDANDIDYAIAERKWNGEDDATDTYKGKSIRGLMDQLTLYDTLQEYLTNGISNNLNSFFARANGATLSRWFTALGYTGLSPEVSNGGTIMGVCTGDFITGYISVFRSNYVYSFSYERGNDTLHMSLLSNHIDVTQATLETMFNAAKNGQYFVGSGYATSANSDAILGITGTNGCNVTINNTVVTQTAIFVPVNQNLKTIYIYKRLLSSGAHTVYTITGA